MNVEGEMNVGSEVNVGGEVNVGDAIILKGLRLACYCGVLPFEQTQRQPYEFDIEVVPSRRLLAFQTDDLADTIDYSELLDRIEEVAAKEKFQVFERLAERVAEVILEDDRVGEVVVEVKKLRPPVSQFLESSGVRIVRHQ